MDERDKTVKLLESFLSEKEVEGVCGYIVDPDGEDSIQVIVVLDNDYIEEANTKPGFIAKMIREGVRHEIKKWLNLDVYVGSISKKCNELEPVKESVVHKYIITESQYNLILESQKSMQFFQELIDNRLDYIRKVCEMSADDYQGDVGHESCNQIDQIDKIEVTDAEWAIIKHSNRPQEEKIMSVRIMIYYSSIRKGDFDADDLTYDLEQMIRKSTGMPFILNYSSTNTNKYFEW